MPGISNADEAFQSMKLSGRLWGTHQDRSPKATERPKDSVPSISLSSNVSTSEGRARALSSQFHIPSTPHLAGKQQVFVE